MLKTVDYDRVEQMLRSGASIADVAFALGIHRDTIGKGMAKRGISITDMKFGLRHIATDEDVAYTAGVFDGEGSVCINQRINRTGAVRYWLTVSVANTDQRLHA